MTPLAAEVHYQVEVLDLHAHLWQVTLTIAKPLASQILQLPVWIPGSYMVREFSTTELCQSQSAGTRMPGDANRQSHLASASR